MNDFIDVNKIGKLSSNTWKDSSRKLNFYSERGVRDYSLIDKISFGNRDVCIYPLSLLHRRIYSLKGIYNFYREYKFADYRFDNKIESLYNLLTYGPIIHDNCYENTTIESKLRYLMMKKRKGNR